VPSIGALIGCETQDNYFAYIFIKIHRTLRVSPAMAAGVTGRLWSVEDLVPLWKPTNSGGRKDKEAEAK
jgi:hypothetical protein